MTTNQKKLIREILDIALDDTVNHIHVDYSGHVDAVLIAVYVGGWNHGAKPDKHAMIYGIPDEWKGAHVEDHNVRVYNELAKMLAYLKQLTK
jgi:hypothetical protein